MTQSFMAITQLIAAKEASLQTGPFGTQLKASDYIGHGIPVINVRNIGFGGIRDAELEYLGEAMAAKLHQHHLKAGDIVFGRKGAVERHALITAQTAGWIQGSDCLRLRINSYLVCNKYLSYYFTTTGHKNWMEALCSFGATMSSLNQDIVKRISFPAPSIEIQRKIAAILSAYDALIENNQRRIALLEKMAEELYREWFVRLRFPGYQGAKFEKGLPEGWRVMQFNDIVEYYIGGGWGEEVPSAAFSDAAHVIRGTDIPNFNAGIFNAPHRFHKTSNLKTRILMAGDFVFEVSGGSKDQLLGRNVMLTQKAINFLGGKVIAASFCKQIRFKTEIISPLIMKYFMKLFYASDLVGLYQIQSTGISNYQFEAFLKYQSMIIPPEALQKSFHDLIQPMVTLKDDLALKNMVLTKSRDMLLPRLISGKLSVDELDIQFPPSMKDTPPNSPSHHDAAQNPPAQP